MVLAKLLTVKRPGKEGTLLTDEITVQFNQLATRVGVAQLVLFFPVQFDEAGSSFDQTVQLRGIKDGILVHTNIERLTAAADSEEDTVRIVCVVQGDGKRAAKLSQAGAESLAKVA